MRNRRRARGVSNSLVLWVFVVFFVSFVDSAVSPVAAQDASPTPEELTRAGTPSVIPELPTVGPVSVSYPIHGQTLTGSVNITGSIALDGWTSYELAFSDANGAAPSWFIFATGTNPVPDGPLAVWDTTTLTDGDYNLRLRVFTPGGSQDVFVYGLRVRNYRIDTPVPTITLTPTASPIVTAVPTATPAPTSTPYSTPTPMPPNPASLRPGEIVFNLGRGALFTALLFGVFGLFLRMRRR
ncbi:MAG: hypothetical protein WA821_10190 [Anaerolineales bacterium]